MVTPLNICYKPCSEIYKKQHQYKDAISTNFARLGLLSLKTISLCLEPCKDTIIISCLLPYQFIENK